MRSVRAIPNLVKCDTKMRFNGRLYRPLGFVSNYNVEAWVRDHPDDPMTPEQNDYIFNLARSRRVKVYCFVANRYQPVLTDTLIFDKWIPTSKIRNAMMDDHLSDYLEHKYGKKKGNNNSRNNTNDNMMSFLARKGLEYEQQIVDYIQRLYPQVCVKVGDSYEAGDYNKYKQTLKYIHDGYGFIFQPVLWNYSNQTFGCADMIVRTDYLKQLCPTIDYQVQLPHYVVIDVKLNQHTDLMPYIKGQLCLYTQALGEMQRYKPEAAFVWSKTGINVLPLTPETERDAADALEWLRNIHTVDENNPLLLPNMKTKNICSFSKLKKQIAKEKQEVTQLWNVTLKHRNRAVMNGVVSLQDPRLCTEVLGITSDFKRGVVDALIKSYQSDRLVSGNVTNYGGWKTNERNYYLDIETICMKHFVDRSYDFVFMIGVGWWEAGEWKYEAFVADDLTSESEQTILQKFVQLVGTSPTFHWGTHEKSVILPKLTKYRIGTMLNLYDMNRWFLEEKIIIKGMLDFKLKTVVDVMNNHKLTDIRWEEVTNGLDAMYSAWNIYTKKTPYEGMRDIVRYNEKDCFALSEIHRVLKNNV